MDLEQNFSGALWHIEQEEPGTEGVSFVVRYVDTPRHVEFRVGVNYGCEHDRWGVEFAYVSDYASGAVARLTDDQRQLFPTREEARQHALSLAQSLLHNVRADREFFVRFYAEAQANSEQILADCKARQKAADKLARAAYKARQKVAAR